MKQLLFLLVLVLTAHLSLEATCMRFYKEGILHDEIKTLLDNDNSYNYKHLTEFQEIIFSPNMAREMGISLEELIKIVKIGFKKEIFCNPTLYSMPTLFKLLKKGFFNEPLRKEFPEIKFFQKDIYPLPTDVFIRDPYHQWDRTGNFYYALDSKKGTLMVRPNREMKVSPDLFMQGGVLTHSDYALGNRPYWNPHDNKGGPALPSGEKIVEFAVAGEIIGVVTDKDRFLLYKPTDLKTPTVWETFIGTPIPQPLNFPPKQRRKAWTFGVSIMEKPEMRRSDFMHPSDIDHYYEDREGKRIEFGLTGTVFVLDETGRKISYWDTGLPANWYRALTTPDRGSFIAENISSAGSTLFIVGRNSLGEWKFYTRMYDYEMNGACPGQYHTFESCHEKQCPCLEKGETAIHPLTVGHRTLPLDPWKEESLEGISSPSLLTHAITVITTGKGNAARELRIEGMNDEGVTGYYYRPIEEKMWHFKTTDLSLRGNLLSHYKPLIVQEPLIHTYKGTLAGKKDSADVWLKDFYYFLPSEEKIELVFKNGDDLINTTLYITDMWTPTARLKDHEEMIGDPDGGQKLLWGTLVIPKEYHNIEFVRNRLLPFHNKVNALAIFSDDEKVQIRSVERYVDEMKHMSFKGEVTNLFTGKGHFMTLPPLNISLKNSDYDEKNSPYFRKINDASLEWDVTANNKEEILKKMKETLKEIQKIHKEMNAPFDTIVPFLVGSGYPVLKYPFILFSPIQKDDMIYAGIERFIPNAMKAYFTITTKNEQHYQKAVKILKDRIKSLKRFL